jgi:acyl dehydratase
MAEVKAGDAIPELKVTPDKYLTNRYAGASGDWNPIHIDAEFAKSVGLPSNILHGLYSMGLVAKAAAVGLADGDPRALKKLSVQFRGMGLPETEVVVTGEVKEVDGDKVTVALEAAQGDTRIIRNGVAELEIAEQ